MIDVSRILSKRLPLLPQRQSFEGPRGSHLTALSRQVSDAFYRCAVEIAKVVYSQIDARLRKDKSFLEDHPIRMEEARKILNESRNDVVEAILPRFEVEVRKQTDLVELTPADEAASNFILANVFDHMIRTFHAYSDLFVASEDVETLDKLIDKVSAVQRERLSGWLLNYKFSAKTIETPGQAAEAVQAKKNLATKGKIR